MVVIARPKPFGGGVADPKDLTERSLSDPDGRDWIFLASRLALYVPAVTPKTS